jgi:hypothetical protein
MTARLPRRRHGQTAQHGHPVRMRAESLPLCATCGSASPRVGQLSGTPDSRGRGERRLLARRGSPAFVERQRCRPALLVVLLHSDVAGVDASICGREIVTAFADERLEAKRASGASDAARQNWYQRGAAMWLAPPRLNGSRRCLGPVAWKGQGRGAQADVAFRALRSPVSATFQTGWRPSRPRQRDHRVHAERRTCSWRDDCSSRPLVEGGVVPSPEPPRA